MSLFEYQYQPKRPLSEYQHLLKTVLQDAIDSHEDAVLDTVREVILSNFETGRVEEKVYVCTKNDEETLVMELSTTELNDTEYVKMKHDEPPTIAEEPISNKRKRKDAWLEYARLMGERVTRVENASSRRRLTPDITTANTVNTAMWRMADLVAEFRQ